MNTLTGFMCYLVIGLCVGFAIGKTLSGRSEEAVGHTFFAFILWPVYLLFFVLFMCWFGVLWLVEKAGIQNAR